MKAWLFIVLGALAVLTGAVWTLQGLGYLEGSPMTDQTLWAVLGPVLALVGLVLLVAGGRRMRRGAGAPPA
jgi:hypothetical protein